MSATRPLERESRDEAGRGPRQSFERLTEDYKATRERTMKIVAPLEIEDYVVQTATYMSPPRWHLGHTTWFFEMVLNDHVPGYTVYNEQFLYFFNSYYERFGSRIDKGDRGTRSRPTVKDTISYRERVDELMVRLLERADSIENRDDLRRLVRLGIEHEMQHQELLVYDIKHLLGALYQPTERRSVQSRTGVEGMAEIEGGLFELGFSGSSFAYDNEKPAHSVYLQDFAIDRAPVTNGQYLQFIEDGGYGDYRWWLSDGWNAVHREGWQAPLYWERKDDQWLIAGFTGTVPATDRATEPVSHISFYEASAFSKWAGKRLPSEGEWEKAACYDPRLKEKKEFGWGGGKPSSAQTNLFETQLWDTAPVGSFPSGQSYYGCHQMIGDAWEWTASDYAPYPGFKSDFDEYNDKFFIGQRVLRGGSYATPSPHIRTTYRNFFYPHERWMISGLRCAKTL